MSTAAAIETKLNGLRFKQRGNTWRGNSPFRNGSDSEGFTVTIDGPENGAYFDHASGEHGSLYDLAERLGIPRPERLPAEQTKVAYRGLKEYAEKHGGSLEAFTKARWTETTYVGRPALKFDTANGPRYRFIDGLKPAFISPAGYESCWYGLARAVNSATERALPLVLVNGEASTVVCNQWGIPAAAVTSGGERKLSEPLLKELHQSWSGRIIVAMDCDATGRKAAADLKAQLSDYSVSVVDLNIGEGGDAADWCKQNGEKSLALLLERAVFTSPDPVKPATVSAAKYLSAASVMDNAAAFYDRVASGETKLTVATGIPRWDAALGGGMWSGLNIIAGSQGMGKSTLMNSLAGLWTQAGLNGFIATTEMTPEQWMTRVWAYLARVRTDELMHKSYAPGLRGIVGDAFANVRASQHRISQYAAPSVDNLRADILELVANKAIDFVMIDSATNMLAPGAGGSIYDQTKAVSNQLNALAREAQTVAGPSRPIPFIVSIQTNSHSVAARPVKIATMLDAYGGQVPSQDATTYTTVNYHTWFVDRQLAKPDEDYPPGVAALIVDKNRFAPMASNKPIRVRFVGGMGFYSDNVPAETGRPVATPTQYKDHDDLPVERIMDVEF